MKEWGIWGGVVVNNADPEKHGRVQVRTPHFGGNDTVHRIPDAELPWAYPCFPFTGKASGFIAVPEIGAGVWVLFYQGDIRHPVWLGGWLGDSDNVTEHDHSTGPPTSYVWKSPRGSRIELSDTVGQVGVEIEDETFQSIKLLPELGETVISSRSLREQVLLDKTEIVGGSSVTGITGAKELTANTISVTALTSMLITAFSAIIAIAAGLTFTVVGTLLITAAVVQILGTSVVLGQVATAQSLCNKAFMDLYNSHTHAHGSGPGTTSPPTPTGAEGVHTTINVRAS